MIRSTLGLAALALSTACAAAPGTSAPADALSKPRADLGPRPAFLVDEMRDGALKTQLQQCSKRGSFSARDFSIGHRGAPLQFPEHTRESYIAAARMGAGIVECDVTFTKDKALVCRHAQNDLHTTTNILATPLAAKCTKAFTPADRLRNGRSHAHRTCRWRSEDGRRHSGSMHSRDHLSRRPRSPIHVRRLPETRHQTRHDPVGWPHRPPRL